MARIAQREREAIKSPLSERGAIMAHGGLRWRVEDVEKNAERDGEGNAASAPRINRDRSSTRAGRSETLARANVHPASLRFQYRFRYPFKVVVVVRLEACFMPLEACF